MGNNQSMTIDWVNELDETIGTIERQKVFDSAAGFRVVHIFISNSRGKLLLEHLGDDAARSPRKWGSSVAGYVHAGETYSSAAKRRLHEERGLQIPLRKLGATTMKDNGALKFITLYGADAELHPEAGSDSDDYLQWFTHANITKLLQDSPHMFTETFPYVYRLFQAVSD